MVGEHEWFDATWNPCILAPMIEVTGKLSTALAGRYRLERHLGEGGMATVYLAHDIKHDRKVALKVLKPELAAVIGGERFLNEIKVTANLQHPNILALYDSGEADSFLYYVMPFIEGESLRDRLDRDKQLGVEEAVEITKSVAAALDYAHRHDVIHRDIKPENILIHDGQALVADFGIALAVTQAGGQRLTETGLSLGTPHYMSPEQATADRELTARSDLYSLACVAYEMLAGEPPHLGNSVQAIIAKIITDDPAPITKHRHHVPEHIDAAIRKALEKTPADRFASAVEFSNALSNPSFTIPLTRVVTPATISSTGRWSRLGPIATGLAILFLAGAVWALQRPTPPTPITRVSVHLDAAQAMSGSRSFDISSDGSLLVYEGPSEEGVSQLWARQWDALQGAPTRNAQELTRGAISPNGQEVAIANQGSVRVLPLRGGVARTIATAGARCCTRWGPDGAWVYFDHLEKGIGRVPVSGGPVEIVTEGDSVSAGFNTYFDVLPSGRTLVYEYNDQEGPHIVAVDLDSGEEKLLSDGQFPRYASGYLLFGTPDGTTLMAAPIDADALEFVRPPAPLAENIFPPAGGYNFFAASQTGKLVYLQGSRAPPSYEIVWLSRDGAITPVDPDYTFDPGGNNRGIALSPDGSQVAITIFENSNYDIWIKELPRGPASRLTFHEAQDVRPRWTPDGSTVTFLSDREFAPNDPGVFAKRAAGTGRVELWLDHQLPLWEAVTSPDQEWLLVRTGGSTTIAGGRDVWALRPGDDSVAAPLIVTPFDEKAITISPDGDWLVYESDETGRNEVYLRPFPNVDDGKWLVSTEGGVMPRWSHSGREIFYINIDNEMVSAQMDLGSSLPVRTRDVLFTVPQEILFRQGEQYALYEVGTDDQRFLMLRAVNLDATEPELILVENWTAAFEEAQGGN